MRLVTVPFDQREAAEIFGGGINAFSRYENGKTKLPLALVELLKVLDRHPDLLSAEKTGLWSMTVQTIMTRLTSLYRRCDA